MYSKLSDRFDKHSTRKQGGADLTYVTGEQVISRLNDVLGVTGWSWRIVREGTTDVEAWVLGELTATIDGVTVTRQHYGNQGLKRGQHAVEDLFKAANTDAIKKAATTIGVGLYLYDEDERREVQAEMREQARNGGRQGLGGIPEYPKQKPTEPTPIKKVQDAAELTGAPPPPAMPSREDLVRAYEKSVREAIDLGHHQSADLKARKAEDLSDAKLVEIGDALIKWIRKQRQAAS